MPRKPMTDEQKQQARKDTVKRYNDAHRDQQAAFEKDTYKKLLIRFNIASESDLIDFLYSQPEGATPHLKNLLKKEMQESLP